jgi:hypothetical protein
MKKSIIILAGILLIAGAAFAVQTGKLTDLFPGSVQLLDDAKLIFGTDSDASIEYDENGTNQLRIVGSTIFENAVEFDGAMSFDGGVNIGDDQLLTFGDGSDWSMTYDEAASDDLLVTGAAGSLFNVLAGNLKVGNGVPTQTQNGEDSYFEGMVEADGVAYLDGGGLVADDTAFAFGNGSDFSCVYDEAGSDLLECTSAAAGGLNILAGNIFVGNGAPTHTINGEDAYIEGVLEVDDTAWLDGGATVPSGSPITFDGTADATMAVGGAGGGGIDVTLGVATEAFSVSVGNLAVGATGAPGHVGDGGDLYVGDDAEIDGVIYSDGGAIVSDQQTVAFGTGSDWTFAYDETTSDDLLVTGAAGSLFNIVDGNLKIGNGSPTQAQNGEDAYVEGMFEADGMCYADGGATVGTSLNLAYATATKPVFTDASKNLISGVFSVASGGGTACNTTCTATKVCVLAADTASGFALVACDSADADVCICLGAP